MSYLYIFICISFTVYGQLVLKWRIGLVEQMPSPIFHKLRFLVELIMSDIYIISGFLAAFLASLFWMAAIDKLALTVAYPFMSLTFVFVMIGSVIFFSEDLGALKIAGTLLILIGLVVISITQKT
jgi:multidrug transporter EmrE-like cation transporter